jgi:hypothetical protein
MDEKSLTRLFKCLEKKMHRFHPILYTVDIIIHYHIGWTCIDLRNIPAKVIIHIFTQNSSNPAGIDFYYELYDYLTSYLHFFSIEDVEFVYSTNPVPTAGIPPLEQRIFQVIEKPLFPELGLYEDLDF